MDRPSRLCKVRPGTITNLGQVSLQTDNVFADDGGIHEIGAISGDLANGMTVALTVPVRA